MIKTKNDLNDLFFDDRRSLESKERCCFQRELGGELDMKNLGLIHYYLRLKDDNVDDERSTIDACFCLRSEKV